MPSVKHVERTIRGLEEFDVRILNNDGRDARSDLQLPNSYDFERQAKGSMTVKEFTDIRLKPKYSGYKFEVLDGNGNPVIGNKTLDNVRKTYKVTTQQH